MAVLKRVGSIGTYRIISEDEFFESFPDNAEKTETELARALETLVRSGYADVRYSSGNMYCLAALKNAPDPVICADERTAEPQRAKEKTRAGSMFWAAFLGGAAGSLLISLIFAFL